MKSLIFSVFILFGASVSFAQKNVSASDFQSYLQKEKSELLVDVRQKWEFEQGYIEEAKNIDFLSDDFLNAFQDIPKNMPIFVYCASGGRSGEAAQLLHKSGFLHVYNLTGGIRAWSQQGLGIKKP